MVPQNNKQWTELSVPEMNEIWEFAFPIAGRMLVRTAEGLYCLDLPTDDSRGKITATLVMTAEEIADLDNTYSWGPEKSQKLRWDADDWFFHGAEGGDITRCDLPTGERLELDENDYNVLKIVDSREQSEIQRITFPISDDPEKFSIAGFSEDFKYLIVCRTEELRVFQAPVR